MERWRILGPSHQEIKNSERFARESFGILLSQGIRATSPPTPFGRCVFFARARFEKGGSAKGGTSWRAPI